MEQSANLAISKEEIVSLVIETIKDAFYIGDQEPLEIDLKTRFEEDLSADKVVLQDAIDSLEEEFVSRMIGFSFDERDLAEVETIGNLVDLICKQVFPREQ